jgi:hypothetical protein
VLLNSSRSSPSSPRPSSAPLRSLRQEATLRQKLAAEERVAALEAELRLRGPPTSQEGPARSEESEERLQGTAEDARDEAAATTLDALAYQGVRQVRLWLPVSHAQRRG